MELQFAIIVGVEKGTSPMSEKFIGLILLEGFGLPFYWTGLTLLLRSWVLGHRLA